MTEDWNLCFNHQKGKIPLISMELKWTELGFEWVMPPLYHTQLLSPVRMFFLLLLGKFENSYKAWERIPGAVI